MVSLCDPARRVLSDLLMMAGWKNRSLPEQMASDRLFTPEGTVNASSIRVANSICTANVLVLATKM